MNKLHSFAKVLSKHNQSRATWLLDSTSNHIKRENELQNENETLQKEIISSMKNFISTYLKGHSNHAKDSKYAIAWAAIGFQIQQSSKLEEIRVSLSLS